MIAMQSSPFKTAADHLRPFAFRSLATTHTGCVRKLNEDACLDRPDIGLWAVADGMGGHSAGDVASATVVQSLNRVSKFGSPFAFRQAVRTALLAANADLFEKSNRDLLDTIGSTVVTLLVHRGHYACIWAGDSRAYHARGGKLQRITHDHSLVQELVDAGSIDAGEARTHRGANIVTRAVGAGTRLDLDGAHGRIEAGDRFLLCSDGLCILSDDEIAQAMALPSLEAVAGCLLADALSRGAPDNVSCVIVECAAS